MPDKIFRALGCFCLCIFKSSEGLHSVNLTVWPDTNHQPRKAWYRWVVHNKRITLLVCFGLVIWHTKLTDYGLTTEALTHVEIAAIAAATQSILEARPEFV